MDKYEIRKRKIGLSIIIILSVTFFAYFITINFIVSLAKGFDEIMLGIPLIIIIIIIPVLLMFWSYNFIKSKNKVM